jgi:hypothetical protein
MVRSIGFTVWNSMMFTQFDCLMRNGTLEKEIVGQGCETLLRRVHDA